MASCCSLTLKLSSFCTLLAFLLSYFGLPSFHCLFPYSPNFHILLHYLFFLFNINLLIVMLNLISFVAFTEDGFTYLIDTIVYFPSIAEHFVTIVSPELSVLFLNKFLHPFFNTNVWLHVTHTGLFFHGGSGSCDFLNFI